MQNKFLHHMSTVTTFSAYNSVVVSCFDLLAVSFQVIMTSQGLTSSVPALSPYESDVEAELEVDQLDSDSEIDENTDPSKPSTSKKTSSKPGERSPGHTLLPNVRLYNILQAEGALSISSTR